MFNPVFNENIYSSILIVFVKGYLVSQGVSQEEMDAWADDLQKLGASGDYFFSANEYIMVSIKE